MGKLDELWAAIGEGRIRRDNDPDSEAIKRAVRCYAKGLDPEPGDQREVKRLCLMWLWIRGDIDG